LEKLGRGKTTREEDEAIRDTGKGKTEKFRFMRSPTLDEEGECMRRKLSRNALKQSRNGVVKKAIACEVV